MRQLQKIFITMALLTSGAANADCSNLVGDYFCATPGVEINISISQSVDDQGGTANHLFSMKMGQNMFMTLIADGTDHIYTDQGERSYNASCQNDQFFMTSSASDGTDPQTLSAYLPEESNGNVMFFSMTKLLDSGVKVKVSAPFCTRK